MSFLISVFSIRTTPYRRHGRHFGRTVFAFTSITPLIIAGMSMDAGTHKRPDSARFVAIQLMLGRFLIGFTVPERSIESTVSFLT